MTPPLIFMAALGAICALAGLIVATRRPLRERQIYLVRIIGVMLAAFGCILMTFAFSYASIGT